MPIAYFKCECGEEHRTVVDQDHTNFTYNEATKHWIFDPTKKDPKPPVRTYSCEKCGRVVEEVPDPKAVKSFLQFNWLES